MALIVFKSLTELSRANIIEGLNILIFQKDFKVK